MIEFGIARVVVLLVAFAAGTLALDASPTSANVAIEVDREPSGADCNPCVVTMGGESHLNSFGIRVQTCSDALSAEIYHNGTGHMSYTNGAHDSGGVCTRIACNGVGEAPAEQEFDILSIEGTDANAGTMETRFCLDSAPNPNGTGTHCNAPLAFAETTSHDYGFDMHAQCAGGIIEREALYHTTGGDNIEIAPPDGASSSLEVDDEPSGEPCDPCAIASVGESHLNLLGTSFANCSVDLEWQLLHDGTGHVDHLSDEHSSGPACTFTACNGIGEAGRESEGAIFGAEETGPGTATASYRFCLDFVSSPNATGMHCTVPVEIAETATHAYAVSAHGQCGGAWEFEGSWTTTDDSVEIDHL